MSTPDRAGWYDDPDDDSRLRYFDGIIWSDRTEPKSTRVARVPADPAAGVEGGSPAGDVPGHAAPGTDVFGRQTQQPSAPQWQQPTGPGHPGHSGYSGYAAAPEPTTEDGQPLASYGARAGAYIIDGLVVAVLNLLVTGWAWWLWMADYWDFVYGAALEGNQDAVNDLTPAELTGMFDWQYFFIAAGLSLLLQAVYHVGFLSTRSATPGKMLLGISVRKVERPGRISAGTAFMRMLLPLSVGVFSLIPLVSYLVFFVTLADLIWPAKDPRRQALHDKIAGTQVVRGRQQR